MSTHPVALRHSGEKTITTMPRITKSYLIEASPGQVYDALTDPILISEWTGSLAEMDARDGGSFSLWGNSIHGINREVSAERIVQDWKESNWEDYSRVEFIIKPMQSGTELILHHDGVPASSAADIDGGWDEYYLEPLKMYLES